MEEREGEKEGREGVSGEAGAQRKKAGERERKGGDVIISPVYQAA